MLFSKTSSLLSTRFGDAGPSNEEPVEIAFELGVDWKVTRSVVDADGVCGVVLDALMLDLF